MAHSTSVKKSQDILVCGLCEKDSKIKVKCMDCDLYMCQKCTDKVHIKFKNADLHDIVALKDIHSHLDETDAESDFKPVKCKDHRKQLCCMYCITCELLVCPMCIAKTHHLHLMEEIQTICQQKAEEMNILQDQACTKMKKYIENLNLMGEIEKSRSVEIEQNILEEEKQAREVQSQCLELLEEHKEKTERLVGLISKKKSEILEEEKDIKMEMHEVENMQKLKNTEKFLEAVSSLQTKLKSTEELTSPKSFNIKIQQHVSNYVIKTSSKSIEMEIQFETKAKYGIDMLDMSDITSITSDKDSNIWITDGLTKIHQVQAKGMIKSIKSQQIPGIITEIRCFDGGVLFAYLGEQDIFHLVADDDVFVFKNLSPNVPYTLHALNNEIIVGMDCSSMEDKMDIPIIIKIGFDAEIIQIYKNQGKQLLTRDIVRCCTAANDGTICYIDSNSGDNYIGDLVFINRDGIIQWKYSGNALINSNEHPFTPIEVLNTKSENFIVSDINQHALHILMAHGELLTILNLTLLGLGDPGVMTIDNNGTLWISSKELDKVKLSSVKFSGF